MGGFFVNPEKTRKGLPLTGELNDLKQKGRARTRTGGGASARQRLQALYRCTPQWAQQRPVATGDQMTRSLPAHPLKRNENVRGADAYGRTPPSDPRSDPPQAGIGTPAEVLNRPEAWVWMRGEKKAVPQSDHRNTTVVLKLVY